MSKEEKAKEYAKVACLDIVRHYNVFTKEEISKFTTTDYLAGYTQAERDLSFQLADCKEALREVISRYEILERSVMVHPDYVFGDDNDEWHTFIDCGKEPLNEAKQLLTDNTQDSK